MVRKGVREDVCVERRGGEMGMCVENGFMSRRCVLREGVLIGCVLSEGVISISVFDNDIVFQSS